MFNSFKEKKYIKDCWQSLCRIIITHLFSFSATLDIPVYKSRIQSLHVLFTLYSVFKNSAHFRQLAEENYIENDDSEADRLIIQ